MNDANNATMEDETMRQNEIYESVTQRMIEQIESGAPPWRRPWMTVGTGLPRNAASGRQYNGINVWLLLTAAEAKGYDSALWATFNQVKFQLGGFVRRGEHGTKIVYWNMVKEVVTDPVTGEDEERKRVFARTFTVFNLCQCGGEALERFREPEVPARPFADYEPAEQLIERSGAEIQFGGGNRAYYDIVGDCIQLPEKHRFDTEADYYSTVLHELSHWTAPEHRCGRTFGQRFGDQDYAFEELVAEMSASFLCATLEIENTAAEQQSASYLAGWLRVLKADRTAIFTASRMAAAASDYLLSFVPAEQPEETETVPF